MTAPEAAMVCLARLLRQLCEDPLPDLAPETPLVDVTGLDSIRLLETVALLEEELQLEIDTQALDGLERVGDILAAIWAARPQG